MILIKTPFRISLVGGGTDFPEFFEKNGYGAVVSGAIDKYMYIVIHKYFHDKIRVKYSKTEDVDSSEQLEHPIARECLQMMKLSSGVEIASLADVPAGLGLGSSSSFTVALLHALHAFTGTYIAKDRLAGMACDVEINRLGEPIGKQDQYAASFGGLNYIRFAKGGLVSVESLMINTETIAELKRRLLVFHIGRPRFARDILTEQRENLVQPKGFELAQRLAQLADEARDAIRDGSLERVGDILDRGWQLKKDLASNISDPEIDAIYARGLEAGASGGKLLGAGRGGFMLFYCEPQFQRRLREALELRELHFEWDREGSKVIHAE